MIELYNVSKTFKKTQVVKPVTVTFETGTISGIVGRNGSGKTVLFKMICGLLRPTTGTITVDGKIIGKNVDFPKSLGCIIETTGFLPNESGYRNLKDLADIRHRIKRDRVKEVIAQVGLDPKSRKPVGKYSMGMKQRLAIAQAIMENPDVLILDEPMNGLDENGVEDIRNLLIEQRSRGKTIVIASHNREDIDILCDEVYQMKDGVLVKEEKVFGL